MRKRFSIALFAATAVYLGALGTAWACSAQMQVFPAASVNPLAAPAGSEATMRGLHVAASTPVELRWEGASGPRLAQAVADDRGEFTLEFTVPEVSPGIYSLVLVSVDEHAGHTGMGRSAIEVTGPGDGGSGTGAGDAFPFTAEAAGLEGSTAGGPPTALVAGVSLLAVGGIVLFAGLAAATLRRPVAARSPRH